MSRHVIIDGYNLLGVRADAKSEQPSEFAEKREMLIRRLSGYSQGKGYAVTVVFDAWRGLRSLEHREHRTGVEVVYTKRGERADQVIQRLARHEGGDCAVVSSDLEIIRTADAHGAFVIRSKEFQRKLEDFEKRGTVVRNNPRAPLSQRYGKTEDDVTLPRRDKKGNPRKLPKSIRVRKRRLKGF